MRTRRQFLVNCTTAAITVSLAPTVVAAPRKPRRVQLDDLTFGALAAQVTSIFVVWNQAGDAVPLVLTGIETPQHESFLDAGNEKFTLVFAGARDQALEQNTYTFRHDVLGQFSLFITRVGRDDATLCNYEAIFNRPPERARRRGRAARRKLVFAAE